MDARIEKALSKLDHGSYSLTVEGFGRRAFGKTVSDKQIAELMRQSGLPERRVKGPAGMVSVWDYDVA